MAMPNHQPFRDWINTEDTILPEQAQALQEHLRTCESCRQLEASWIQLRQTFHTSAPIEPAPGFVMRWQVRLAEQRRIQHRRQSLVMLAFTGGVAFVLFLILSGQALELLRSPYQMVLLVIYRMASLVMTLDTTQDVLLGFLKPIPGTVAIPLLIILSGITSFMSVLWIVVFKQLTFARRIRS